MAFTTCSVSFEADIVQVLPSVDEQAVGLLLHRDAEAQLTVWYPQEGPDAVTLMQLSGLLARRCQWVFLSHLHGVGIIRELAAKPYPETAAVHAFDVKTGLPLWSLPNVDVLENRDEEGLVSLVPVHEPDAEAVWVRVMDGEAAIVEISSDSIDTLGLKKVSVFTQGTEYYPVLIRYCQDMNISVADRILYAEWQSGIIIGSINRAKPELYYARANGVAEVLWTASSNHSIQDAQNLHGHGSVWTQFSVALGRCLYVIWQDELHVVSAC